MMFQEISGCETRVEGDDTGWSYVRGEVCDYTRVTHTHVLTRPSADHNPEAVTLNQTCDEALFLTPQETEEAEMRRMRESEMI